MSTDMPRPRIADPFVRALADIENTLTASHIAVFPVVCAAPTNDVAQLYFSMAEDQDDYSHMPVREADGRVSGVLHREELTGASGKAGQWKKPLAPDLVIEASTSLRKTITQLRHTGLLLVRSVESGHPDGISGIINHADIQKLPVKILLFTQISEVESRLRILLKSTNWENTQAGRQATGTARQRAKQWKNDALPVLHYLNLRELGLLAHNCGLLRTGGLDEATVVREMEDLRQLRNAVAHGQDYNPRDNALESIEAMNAALLLVQRILNSLS